MQKYGIIIGGICVIFFLGIFVYFMVNSSVTPPIRQNAAAPVANQVEPVVTREETPLVPSSAQAGEYKDAIFSLQYPNFWDKQVTAEAGLLTITMRPKQKTVGEPSVVVNRIVYSGKKLEGAAAIFAEKSTMVVGGVTADILRSDTPTATGGASAHIEKISLQKGTYLFTIVTQYAASGDRQSKSLVDAIIQSIQFY